MLASEVESAAGSAVDSINSSSQQPIAGAALLSLSWQLPEALQGNHCDIKAELSSANTCERSTP